MRKLLPILSLCLLLAGCSQPNIESNTSQVEIPLAEELKSNLDDFRLLVSQPDVLDDIRYVIGTGDLNVDSVSMHLENLIGANPMLSNSFKYVEDSLYTGYDWDLDVYFCLYKVETDTQYTYITATFNPSFECIHCVAAPIQTYPHLDTSSDSSSDPDDLLPDGYIPRPVIPEGTTTASSNTASNPEGTTSSPSDTTSTPEGTTTASSNTSSTPEGTTEAPNPDDLLPDGYIPRPIMPDSSQEVISE